jgi:hypothetical protein
MSPVSAIIVPRGVCIYCRFFQPRSGLPNDPGQCRRNPPVLVPKPALQSIGLWPPVTEESWCGQYAALWTEEGLALLLESVRLAVKAAGGAGVHWKKVGRGLGLNHYVIEGMLFELSYRKALELEGCADGNNVWMSADGGEKNSDAAASKGGA